MENIKKRAERLNQTIKQSGLSFAELEKLTGIAKSSIQRYAAGRTQKIPIENIELLAHALHVTPRYLLLWDEPQQKNAPVEVDKSEFFDILKTFSKEELEMFKSLSRDEAVAVVMFVDDLISRR
jgi:transcriptional regulator with XRE-family HTH domain